MRERRDAGESLIEIVFSIVIISLTVTALVSSLATAGNAGTAQRNSVQADVVIRDYAEATKAATQRCTVVGAPLTVDYTAPAGFAVTAEPAVEVCPDPAVTQMTTLTVTALSTGGKATMQIRVRTP